MCVCVCVRVCMCEIDRGCIFISSCELSLSVHVDGSETSAGAGTEARREEE